MSRILIRGGRVIDPSCERDEVADVLVDEGRIAAVGPELDVRGAEVLDASDCWVAPGFVDMHTHLREPGQEYKEDLASGGRAGVAGGFTALACMANTEPVNDDPSVTEYIIDRARQESPARVHPIAAATQGLDGRVMTEMSALRDAGAVAFSDDGMTIMDTGVMRRVLEYSRLVDALVMVHAEDCSLVGHGVVNEGPISTKLGLPGNPTMAEDILVGRDLALARLTGARLHIAHISSAGSVALVRRAREEGVQVTAEVAPHHLTLTDEATLGFDTNTKMAPPLRSRADVEACRKGLAEGVIDAIATDHAPHAVHEKEQDFEDAPPGILGLETAYPVVLDLVREGVLTRSSSSAACRRRRPGCSGSRAARCATGHPATSRWFRRRARGPTIRPRATRRAATRPGPASPSKAGPWRRSSPGGSSITLTAEYWSIDADTPHVRRWRSAPRLPRAGRRYGLSRHRLRRRDGRRGRGRLQHVDDRLSGDPHRPVLYAGQIVTLTYHPHRQRRYQCRRRWKPRGVNAFCAVLVSHVTCSARASNFRMRSRQALQDWLGDSRDSSHCRHRHTKIDAASCANRARR